MAENLDLGKLRQYFAEYNKQWEEVGGAAEIDVSSGLDKILESIEHLAASNHMDISHPEVYAARHRFCWEATMYFLATGEIPAWNAQEVFTAVGGISPYQSLENVASGFNLFADRLKQLREDAKARAGAPTMQNFPAVQEPKE